MLGSCSKDDTEVAPVEVKGKVAFSAVLPVGGENETRTHLNEKGQYVWDDGDMLGASVMGGTEVVPFVADPNAEAGQTRVDFLVVDNDLDYLGAGPYYVAYPYDKTVAVAGTADAPTMKMTIPASQRYRANSFATMTAPAVGVVQGDPEKDGYYNPGVSEVTLHAACSYIRIPVKGAGSLTELKLQIQKASSSDLYVLNGAGDVAFAEGDNQYVLDLNGVGSTATAENNYVKISFGAKGLDLKYGEEANLLFVVPAHIPLRGSVIKYEAIVDGKPQAGAYNAIPDDYTEKLPRNMILPMSAIELGMEDKVLIGSNAEFIEYLYAVSKGTGDPAATDYVKDGAFKTAILTGDLNFNRYDARNDINGADDVLQAALTEYMANGNAIAPIAAGAKIDGGNYTVSYLAVKGDDVRGNGIFGVAAASLKNITFSNTTVTPADADEENPVFFGVLPTECEGVTVSGGTLVTTAENAAVLGEIVFDDLNKVAVKSYPKNSDKANVYYAAKITLGRDVDVLNAENADVKAYFNSSSRRFGAIKATSSDVKISGVTTSYVRNLLAAISYDGTDKAISVIDAKGTSYWTGGVAESVAADRKIETAEQLAYVVKNGGSRLTLGNNIDLQGVEGKVWTVAGKTVAIDGGSKTITNAKIGFIDADSPVATGYYSLLGNKVTVSNLTVSKVEIDVDNVTSRAYVGGLGLTGSANGVTVSDLSIKIGSNVKAINGNVIGGLVSTLSAASVGNKVTNLTIDLGGKEGVTVGALFGILNRQNLPKDKYIDGNSVVYKKEAAAVKYPLLGAWTVYGSIDVAACRVCEGDDLTNLTDLTDLTASTEENPIAPVVGVITFNPTNVTPGTQILLNLDGCSTPYYSEIKNAVDYAYNVKINGNDVPVDKPE